MIDSIPLTSAIREPARDARLAAGLVTVRGYAMASGRRVVWVDVSGDCGRTRRQAELERHGDAL